MNTTTAETVIPAERGIGNPPETLADYISSEVRIVQMLPKLIPRTMRGRFLEAPNEQVALIEFPNFRRLPTPAAAATLIANPVSRWDY
jgi:hypothetical protein